jgi:hypothetical protein
MPIYSVDLEATVMVVADSPQQAAEVALDHVREISRSDFGADVDVVRSGTDVLGMTDNWTLDSLPFGGDGRSGRAGKRVLESWRRTDNPAGGGP